MHRLPIWAQIAFRADAYAMIMTAIDPAKYSELANELRTKLVNAQYDLKNSDTSVILLLAGNDLPGCEEFIDVMQEWVDVRYVDTRAFRWPTEEETLHPPLWRYWRAMPRNGRIAVFYGAWIMNLMLELSVDNISGKEFRARLMRLNRLEKLLMDDGRIVLKIWLHASKKMLKKRLRNAEQNPAAELYVGQFNQNIYDVYKKSESVIELLNNTLGEHVAWQWVDGADSKARNITIAQRLLAALEQAQKPLAISGPAVSYNRARSDYLAAIDLSRIYEYSEYRARLQAAQLHMKQLFVKARKHGITPVIAFEGWDAAGKGGVIRRVTRAMPAWSYRVVPVGAPTAEERDYHYLWRFWRAIPRAGKSVIFDRSWYGRVLVERVEGYASDSEWTRAYREIVEFESELVAADCCVLKFWLHIDADEQLTRFRQREKTAYKKYKITAEDYRNREKWRQYERAVNDMVENTSTDVAPWHLIPANSKRYARVEVIETVCAQLGAFIKQHKKKNPPGASYSFHHL